jgi:hypothetical protein
VVFSQTDLLGVYSAMAVFPDPTPAPSGRQATAGSSAFPSPRASGAAPTLAPGASPTPVPTAPPLDPNAPVRFAVDLFDPSESNIAPGSAAAIEALGRAATASAGPGSSTAPTASPTPAPTAAPGSSAAPGGGTTDGPAMARDELWVVVVLVVIAFLLVEWLVYHRDAVTRLWRGFRGRGARGAGAATTPGSSAGTKAR